jgi:hypothetical protein
MSRPRRTLAAVATALALILVPTAAWADYRVSGTISGLYQNGFSGSSQEYRAYVMNAGGKTFCVNSSQVSSNNPVDASKFSHIYVRSNGTQWEGGYGDLANGRKITVNVNTSASPQGCGGKNLAYLVWIDL